MNLEIGKTYVIDHRDKPPFSGRLTEAIDADGDPTWGTFEIVSGVYTIDDLPGVQSEYGVGEKVSIHIASCEFTEQG